MSTNPSDNTNLIDDVSTGVSNSQSYFEYRQYSLNNMNMDTYGSDDEEQIVGGADKSIDTFVSDLNPSKIYDHISKVKNEDLSEDDLQTYLYAIIDHQGLIVHNLVSYSEFLDRGVAEILQQLFKINRPFPNTRDITEADKKIKTIKLNIEFSDIHVGMPTHGQFKGGETQPLFPREARLTGVPYSAPITMSCLITMTAIDVNENEDSISVKVKPFTACNIPIMTGSSKCHTRNLTRAALKFHGEDPNEEGGVFILKGQEFIIDHIESSRFNKLQCHFIDSTELNRGDFLSQPPNERFGNSSQVKISLMSSGQITIEINSIKFLNVKIPFYLVYRLLGMTDASEIVRTIIYDDASTNPDDIKIKQILNNAFHIPDKKFGHVQYESNRRALIEGMAREMVKNMGNRIIDETKGEQKSYVNQDLLLNMDNVFLPHMGKTPDSRIVKLRVLGTMIREVLLTHLGVIPASDRDSLANKRMQGAGTCMPKLFKTMFNSYIITPFLNQVRKEIKNSPWDQIKTNINRIADLFENVVQSADLTRGLEQGITSSNKTITRSHQKELANRVSSKLLERKNFLNYVCSLRSVISHGTSNASKQTKRADEIRRVHPTMPGYICPIHSADSGENVGTKKNLALTATICGAGNSYNLKLKLLSDPDVIELKKVKLEDISKEKLSSVYVNGEWIGCTKNGHQLVERYRKLRREHKTVDRFTTIVWDTLTDKVDFLLDADRLLRPLLIVDSNIEEYKTAKRSGSSVEFLQNVRLTKKHIDDIKTGEITFGDLVEDGIVEYVSPEEHENCWVCPSLADLRIHKNNVLNQYTHLEIEASILGLASHISVLANYTQPARSTYESNQSRQTAGWYALNFQDRADKNKTWQYYNQTPLCRTITARYIPPNGNNIFIGYMCNGANQEDSVTFKKSAAERGLFSCSFFKKESHELEQDEEFATPDPRRTKNMKSNGNYNKLIDGVTPIGTTVVKGDILIGVIMKNNRRGQSNKTVDYEFVDRSIMYKSNEPAVVSKVIDDRGPNHERFITVVLRYQRNLMVGDKCLDLSHDVLTDQGWLNIDEVTMYNKVATVNPKGEIEYHLPTRTIGYEVDEEMYEIENTLISQCVTKNHSMYVSKRYGRAGIWQPYELVEAESIFGQRRKYKMDGINTYPDIEFHEFGGWKIPMDFWLQFLGIWIADGFANDTGVYIKVCRERKIEFITRILQEIGVSYRTHMEKREGFLDQQSFVITDKIWKYEFIALSKGAVNKSLPDYVWKLSQSQCRILLDSLIEGDGTRGKTSEAYYTSSQKLADDIQRLCTHAGYAGTLYTRYPAGTEFMIKDRKIVSTADGFEISIIKDKLRPEINNGHTKKQSAQTERYVHYKGRVACLEVPNHTFFVRRNGKVSITGNCSTRSGNKAISAIMSPESDLPYTESGITLDCVMNPHSLPSRMTIGQVMETTLSKVCARKGISIDITAFRNVTPENLMDTMQQNGFRYNGKERMFNGETGRYYDIGVFCGPTYVQKLQKYVLDNGYSVSRTCPTDATTGQPLSGKASNGGLRLGEMELWSLEAHGAEAFTYEKFSQDSDGFRMWICRRCGHHAVYNQRDQIYTCKRCKDLADISIVESTRASVVFQQELAGSNIKVKLGLKPREFEVLE